MEVESLGFLTKRQYDLFLKKFTNLYGKPVKKKRLSISFWNPAVNKNIDTRIRITNGEAEIVQKFGKWENLRQMKVKEIFLNLSSTPDEIFNAYLILRNTTGVTNSVSIMQYENGIFDLPDFEVKLGRQFGKSAKYFFEVEIKESRKSLKRFLEKFGLSEFVVKTDVKFWKEWNKEVNLTADDLPNKEIRELIRRYLSASL